MFAAAELKLKVSRAEFDAREPILHAELLAVQRALREADFPVVIIVSGVEGAGKGEVVRLLNKWLDVRGLETHAFWEETDEERQRPRFWRFWRALPAHGRIGILFGSWYSSPIINAALGKRGRARFDRELERIRHFEDMLADDGVLLVKFWFHLSARMQNKRLRIDAADRKRKKQVSPVTRAFAKHYDRFAEASERALRRTDVAYAAWHVIAAANARYRDLRVGEILLQQLKERLAAGRRARSANLAENPVEPIPAGANVLSSVALDKTLVGDAYRRALSRYKSRLYDLAWEAHRQRVSVVAVFEGWDAAGKGGAIRRVTQAMDARLYRVISIAAPTDEERAHHYLWRFWRQLPRAGYHTIYDRSWYGRVLVERVENFASTDAWLRAYNEINSFEEQLHDHGIVVIKNWIHIDRDEQLRRFREREETANKQHKITAEDWRNRERWNDYESAVHDMVARTSTAIAPWKLVAGNDKRHARVEVLKHYCKRLEAALR